MVKIHFMRKIFFLFVVQLVSVALFGGTNPNQLPYNFSSFSKNEKRISHELDYLTPSNFKSHPDFGKLPYNAPCINCVELEDHRDATSRYFVKAGSKGKRFYKAQSFGAINYLDKNGWWREINYRLQPQQGKIYAAPDQPSPVTVDLNQKFSSIKNRNKEIQFNKNLELYYKDESGKVESLGTPDWTNYTAGDDGILVSDFYPGIDLQMIVTEGRLKTNFILNNHVAFTSGWLVMKQAVDLPKGLAFDFSETSGDASGKLLGDIRIIDQDEEYFKIHSSIAFDATEHPHVISLGSEVNASNELLTYIPVSWLNDSHTVYPVIIDPTVSSTGSLPLASITGSQYNAVCWTGGCNYNLSFLSPANCTITDIRFSFNYNALGLCTWQDGGVSFTYGGCRSPSSSAHTCGLAFPGLCILGNVTIFNDFQPCIPPPQCSPYMMNFDMQFYRCNNDPTPGCGSGCIAAASAWTMVVEGETLKLDSITADQQICEGDSVSLQVYPGRGVAPYSYLWTPVGSISDSINVSPTSTTVYHVAVTDNCGQVRNDSVTVNVIPNNNPGFTITPNPGCVGQNIILTGLGSGAAADYDWLIPSSSQPTVNDSQTVNIQYASPANYSITLNYTSGVCNFPFQQNVDVFNIVTPTLNVTSTPPVAGTTCSGTSFVFNANPVNGGTAPVFQWKVNGTNAGTNSDTFSVVLNTTSTVSVSMISNLACVTSATAQDSMTVSITPTEIPGVNISSNLSSPYCSGVPIVFTAAPTFGGSTPIYQWQVNGLNAGTNSDTFSIATLTNGDIVRVTMTSNYSCPTPATATDTIHAAVVLTVIPSVSINVNPNDSVCSGSNVVFSAVPSNGGATPGYQWNLNGVAIGGANTNTYSTSTSANGDVIGITMTSSNSCASPPSVSDSVTMNVSPNITPAVTLTVIPNDTVCAGTNVSFTASPFNGGTTPSYQWQVNSGNTGTNSATFSSSTLANGSVVSVIMTSNAACITSSTATNQILMTMVPVVSPSVNVSVTPNDTACTGDNLTFNALPLNEGTVPVYQWSVNSVNTGGNSTSYSSSSLNNGDTVTVSLTSNAACVSPATVSSPPIVVTLDPLLTPSVTITATPPGTICMGASVQFQATPVNGGTNPSYQWLVDGNNNGTNSAVLNSSTLIQGNGVSVNMTSAENCVTSPNAISNTIFINTYPLVNASASGSTTVCPKELVTLHAFASAGNGGPYNYSWSNGAGNGSTADVTPSSTTNYIVSITDGCGTAPATASVLVNVLPGPTALFSYSPNDPSSYHSEVSFLDLSLNAVQWSWNFGDGDTSLAQNPVHLFPAPGNYNVSLVVMNPIGCNDTIIYRIFVREDVAVYVPNSFTPNGDGWNDSFAPMGNGLGDYEMIIYDRWGNEVFKGSALNSWTGSGSNNKPAPSGVYLYKIDLKDAKFDPQIVTGGVTLIR